MDESVILPSPNWFLASNLAVSTNGWLIYGGPSRSLCILEPRKADEGIIAGNDKYQAHVVPRAHIEKIVVVDISPEWLEKKSFLTGSVDGTVKQWVIEVNNKLKVKATLVNDVHYLEKEDVIGVGYSNETMAITVGGFSNIVKWNLSSNVTTIFPNFIRGFKPSCMSCSQHLPMHVAVGTKQGVVFLLDLNGQGRTLYKVRGHDDEIMNVSWCPKYEVTVKKIFKETKSYVTSRLEAIRNEGVKETNVLEQSGIGKNLPEDSFDESIVQEDDMFDIYTDHEPDEFGHKKYEPEDILVKVKKEKADDTDYLAECLKLKEDILKRKNQPDPTIESLVDALDKTHVEALDAQTVQTDLEGAKPEAASTHSQIEGTEPQAEGSQSQTQNTQASRSSGKRGKADVKIHESIHIHKHLLASIGKFGGVKIWSKSGKLVGTCITPVQAKGAKKVAFATSLLWYKPDSLLVVDVKSQLLEIKPLRIDSKNKLNWQLVHTLHKRGMYCIATNAPRVQTESTVPSDDWSVWSSSQDRNIIRYSLTKKEALGVHATCGGFVYTVLACPYDAGKFAISVGDGAVRVLETSLLPDDDTKLSVPSVTTYWQNVQGKVLSIAWHPTKENLLAFATAEARVGLLDTSNRSERPARVLYPALNKAVYGLSWGEGMHLYASGGGSLVMYRAQQSDEAPETIDIEVEGQKWEICAVAWTPRGLLVGSAIGAVALFTHRLPHTLIAAAFIYTKIIHAMEWHPQQTSTSSEESPYRNLIAVTSLERECNIVILEYGTKEDGTKQLTTWKTLSGHKHPVLQAAWNPHRDGLLLTSSQDSTVRVWDISTGTCISIFGGHSPASLGVCWVSEPQLPHHVLSGGAEACVRLWDIYQHKAENYDVIRHEVATKKSRKKEKTEKAEPVPDPRMLTEDQENVATKLELTKKTAKPPKKFLLPIMYRQINDPYQIPAPKKMLQLFLKKNALKTATGDGTQNVTGEESPETVDEKGDSNTVEEENVPIIVNENDDDSTSAQTKEDTESSTNDTAESVDDEGEEGASKTDTEFSLDFLKMFGSIRDVNEFLDIEMDNHFKGHYNPEACIMLSIFRGHIDTMIQFASQRDMLCPFLLSMAPCVSFKYWKDATQLYLSQIDRLVAKGEEEKLYENRQYGGPKYRKAAILLSMHDVMGAVTALCEGKLFKEAYVLCRIRYMDSVAEEVLRKWAGELTLSGQVAMASVCYMAMNDMSQAAQVLAKSNDEECLNLAAEIAKIAGRTTFAYHVQKKAKESKSQANAEKTEEILKDLPSKIELLMKENKVQNCDNLESDTLNGEPLNGDETNE